MARFVSFAVGGVPPEIMGIGPIVAIPKALKLAGLKLEDIGLVELNEAFAVQALAVAREAGLNMDTLNVNGGAIALGHPLGCTGAKLTATILQEMKRRKVEYGMVTMCIGGGQGAAGIFEECKRQLKRETDGNHGHTTIRNPENQRRSVSDRTRAPEEMFTPEDFTAEHHAIAKTTEEFFNKEVAPHVNEINNQQHAVPAAILRKSAALGLTAVVMPEKFGGMEMDLTSMMVVAEGVARDGSYSAWHGAHTGIGTLPVAAVRNRRAEGKISAEAGHCRNDRGILP